MILFTKEKQYLPLVNQAAARHKVPAALILAHIKTESGFNPNARRDEYDKNGKVWDTSWGLGQILLGTAKTLDSNATVEKLLNPAYNIDLAAKLIAKNLDRYKNRLTDAVAAYNAGSAMKDVQGRYVNRKGVPNVQSYVNKVISNYNEYAKWIDKGAKTFDPVSVNPMLVAGFAAVLIITIISGGVYVSRRKGRRVYRLAA